MFCSDLDEIQGAGFRPSPAYCAALKAGDAEEFCSPVPPVQAQIGSCIDGAGH
jgi:hypothetical protein